MTSMDMAALTATIEKANVKFLEARQEIGKVIVGQKEMVDYLLVALLADGHILLEGLPGLAKTLAVTTLAKVVNCEEKRIQFTPDLLPADLVGTSIYNPKDGSFSISKGPVFTNILLADEINRAPAKVQSALLEVMQEKQVTISGQTFSVGKPYFVLATQNPIEQEGTYPLPEAQTDRFMLKIKIDYPSKDEEKEILKRMATLGPKPEAKPILNADEILAARKVVNSVYIDDKVTNYILDLVFATRYPKKYGLDIEPLLLTGASPRASIALFVAAKAHAFLAGRAYVVPQDIKDIAHAVLRHRLRRSYEAEAEDVSTDDLIDRILKTVPVP
jgi:MoxR-like ATPase